ncbi:GM15971 [Drosophila sechellia]|uniref:GM15971 n=1 Tax=Drosophila sechellia TaxID=7238 RepID=B4HXN0_DROSE|nr:GM15971 [Drosophila sechellia]
MSEINGFRCRFILVVVACAPLLGSLDRQLNELLIRLPAPDCQTYPSPGVVMAAAVVCWPLTRQVKMPQNQGEMLHCALQITAPQLEQQCRGHTAQEGIGGGGGTRGRVAGVMPRQSDVQSRKAYVLRMESLAPPWTAITDRVTTLHFSFCFSIFPAFGLNGRFNDVKSTDVVAATQKLTQQQHTKRIRKIQCVCAGCDQHDLRIHLVVAADESSDGQPDEDARDDPDHEDGGHGANNLSAIPAEGHPVKDKSECSLINVGALFYSLFFVFWFGQSQHLNGSGGGDQVEGRSIKAQPRRENKPSHIRTSQEQDQNQDQPACQLGNGSQSAKMGGAVGAGAPKIRRKAANRTETKTSQRTRPKERGIQPARDWDCCNMQQQQQKQQQQQQQQQQHATCRSNWNRNRSNINAEETTKMEALSPGV